MEQADTRGTYLVWGLAGELFEKGSNLFLGEHNVIFFDHIY